MFQFSFNQLLRRSVRHIPDRMLVLTWSPAEVTVIDVTRHGTAVTIHTVHAWPWPSSVSTDTPVEAGSWLKQRIQECGWTGRATLLVPPRQSAIFKLLEVPQVPAVELADVVLLQAESRLSRGLDEFVCDFLAHPSRNGQTQPVLLAAWPRQKRIQIEQLCQLAGLNLIAISPSELASASAKFKTSESLHLIVVASEVDFEFTLACEGLALATTVVASGNGPEFAASLIAAANRVKAGLPPPLSDLPLNSITVYGPTAQTTGDSLKRLQPSCQIVVERSDDSNVMITRAVLALLGSGQQSQINFLSPRKPVDPQQSKRRQMVIRSLCAALLIAVLWYGFDRRSTQLHDEMTQLKNDIRDLEQMVERGQNSVDTAQWLGDWEQATPAWPTILPEFLAVLPGQEKAYLSRLHLELSPAHESPLLQIQGRATDTHEVTELHRRLVAISNRFQFQPRTIEPIQDDPQYQASFDIEATLVRDVDQSADSSPE